MRRDLLRPDASERADGDASEFRHDLIRDAAYQALPKRERAELHERLATAEREVRLVYDAHQQTGDEGHLVSSAAELADVLAGQGRDDEALRLTEVSEAGAAPDDLAAQLVWRRVRAEVLARRGDMIPAEQLARAAVALADRTDWLEGQGDALADLGEVQRLAGRPREAAETLRAALARYERKDAVALADRVRNTLG